MARELFTGWYDPNAGSRRIAIIGDLHVATEENLTLLKRLIAIRPDQVILSNLSGSPIFQEIKRLFYDIHNPAAHELKIGTPNEGDLSDQAILSHVVEDSVSDTLRERFSALERYRHSLSGKSDDEIKSAIAKVPDSILARCIWQIGRSEYVGRDWFAHQPKEFRAAAASQIQPNAERFGAAISKLISSGIDVTLMEGNLDLHSSNIHGNFGWDVYVFDTMSYYQSLGVKLVQIPTVQITDNAVIVFEPYWTHTPVSKQTDEEEQTLLRRIEDARAKRVVIVIAGCELCLEPHFLHSPIPTGSRADMTASLNRRIAKINPDRVFYSRLPKPFCDAGGYPYPLSTGYAMVRKENGMMLHRSQDSLPPNSTLVHFVPSCRAAFLHIPPEFPLPRALGGQGLDPFIF